MWQSLAPHRWPLAPELLPGGTLLVGGAVRDALLGRLGPCPDLDLVVEGDAIALSRSLARRCGGSCVVLDPERSIARLVLQGWSFDLARCMGDSWLEDLARRDYSINAMALPLASRAEQAPEGPGLLDPGGGLEDLRQRRLRALGEANLLDDPLRLLRGVRLACELDFTLEPRTLGWIHAHRERLAQVAGERVLAELERLAAAPDGARGLQQVQQLDLLVGWQALQTPEEAAAVVARLGRLTPERAHHCGLPDEEAAWALPLARLAALLTPDALQALHASRRLQQRCRQLRRWLQALEDSPSRRKPDAAGGPAEADGDGLSLAGLAEAPRLALQRDLEQDLPALLPQLKAAEARGALTRWQDPDDPLFHPRPPLDGRQLQQALQLAPGPRLGVLLAHLSQERAFGRLDDGGGTEAALRQARLWLAEQGAATPKAATDGTAT